MKTTARFAAPIAALLAALSLDAAAQTIPTGHPRILLTAPEAARLQARLGTTPSIVRFRNMVDGKVFGGQNPYGYQPWYSALMGVVTGNPAYCTTSAVPLTEAFVASEEALIAANQRPEVAGDSYLEVGEYVGSIALVYDWCYAHLTPAQRTRWGNYAAQAVWNVWNPDNAVWGVTPFPWSGWSIDNPVNNYYYSFLRATMLLGLVTKYERVDADTWIAKFRTEKIANQLVPTFVAQLQGGGSREGTGYGTAMKGLFGLYYLWEKTTGERIADLTGHAQSMMPYMLHALSPTRDLLAPIGDHARDSEANFYDYHREMLIALASIYDSSPLARRATATLAASSRPEMGDAFNTVWDFLYAGASPGPAARLHPTYYAPGTGHLFTRSSWDTNATWLTFLAGPYSESHAHQDGLSLMVFKNGWLVDDANRRGHSGIYQDQDAHGMVVQRVAGTIVRMYERPSSSAVLRALADRPAYVHFAASEGTLYDHPSTGNPGVRLEREVVFIKPDVVVVFDRVNYAPGSSVKTFQLPVPTQPIIAGRNADVFNGTSTMRVHFVGPPSSAITAVAMPSVDADFNSGYRLDSTVTTSGLTHFLNVLDLDFAVSGIVTGTTETTVAIAMADGRLVTVAFNPDAFGGTIEIRNVANEVLVAEALATTVTVPPVTLPLSIAARDADATGTSDIFWTDPAGQAAVWLMNGVSPTGSALLIGPASGWTMASALGDFNADGRADILWQHTSGMWAIWLMDGATPVSSAVILGPSTGWEVSHLGDFNGDGSADLLWKHADGSVALWLMNGLAPSGSTVLFGAGVEWSVSHVADLDGDARADLVWRASDGRAAAWLMNGIAPVASALIFGAGTTWQVAGAGDFDANGTQDLLWKDAAGQLAVWLMNGLATTQSAVAYDGATGFQVTHLADFDGNGTADVLLKDAAGTVLLALMNGIAVAQTSVLFGGGSGWTVTHTGDYNGDGKADLLWKDAGGQAAIWMMDGAAVVGSAVIYGGGGWVAAP